MNILILKFVQANYILVFYGGEMSEIKEKLKLVCKEIENRQPSPNLKAYNSGNIVHKKQIAFHKCKKRNRWVFGGNRSGKSECGAVEVVYLSRGIHPYRKNRKNVSGWVVSLSRQVQRDVAQQKILHYLKAEWIEKIVMQSGSESSPESGVIDFIVVKNVFGGTSKIGFKSCDQGREKFQGSSLDFVWFDEEPPFDIYRECQMRVLDRCGDIFGTMTPLKGMTWVYNEIYLNCHNSPEVWCEHMQWEDNPFLSKTEIDLLSQTMAEDELESRKYGKFSFFGGLVYPEFDEKVHVIEPFDVPCEWYDNISIDPGLNNPLSAHFYAVDYDGNIFVIAEHFEAKKDVTYHAKKILEIAQNLNWHFASNGMLSALIDSAASQRTLASQKSVVDLFYENNILVNPRVNKDMFSGISTVKRYLKDGSGQAHIFIFKNCVNLIKEFKSYFWGDEDAPIKKDDHSLDELRYYLMSKPSAHLQPRQKSAIEIDKERLIRKIRRKWK